MTEGMLRGRRDTFWETAPAYDGRKEIWDALKAACEAVGEGDHGLAQAILDGANISLPRGNHVYQSFWKKWLTYQGLIDHFKRHWVLGSYIGSRYSRGVMLHLLFSNNT